VKNSWLWLLVIAGIVIIGLVIFSTNTKKSANHPKIMQKAGTPVRSAQKDKKISKIDKTGPKLSKARLNDMRKSLIDLREKAGADPHHAMRWIAIARVYNNMGDYYKACQYLKKSMEMEPKFNFRGAVEEIIEQCNRKYPGLSIP